MTAAAVESANAVALDERELGRLYQYTVEAYKTFQKLAESLPNPMTATMFKQMAVDERENRDLIEMKIAAASKNRIRATLGADQIFMEILEGELSFRESAEFLIGRERTMQKRLRELASTAGSVDRNFLIYVETVKRSHIVELERELELIKGDADWWKREDAEWLIVNGPRPA